MKMDDESGSDSEYETVTDDSEEEENELGHGKILKPVFIPKAHRITIKEKGNYHSI
jgi:hypothetical protein